MLGTFTGQCAEYCGISHANMRLRVIAESEADYDAWVAQQQTPLASDKVAQFTKQICEPVGLPLVPLGHEPLRRQDEVGATIGPNLTHVGDREAFAGDIYPMTLDNLAKWVYDAPGPEAPRRPGRVDARLLARTA